MKGREYEEEENRGNKGMRREGKVHTVKGQIFAESGAREGRMESKLRTAVESAKKSRS